MPIAAGATVVPPEMADDKFSWTGEIINGAYVFRGFTDSRLYWQGDHWRLELLSDPDTHARVNSTEIPFGTFTWEFNTDPCGKTGDPGRVNSTPVTLN